MKLQLTLLAALGAAACASVQAASVVEMYGTAFPFLESVKTTGATLAAPADRPNQVPAAAYTGANDPSRKRISVGTSAWGFRGYEDLSPALKLVWQLESGFQIDQNVGPGIGARNSKVGLQGGWGEVFLGQWDTPYKAISTVLNPLRGGYVFDYTPLIGNPGMGVNATTTQFTRAAAKADAAFDRRQGNSIQYWSPKWGGFTTRVGYSVNEGRTGDTATVPGISPVLLSAVVQYDAGALSLRYGYEQHRDYFGLSQLGGSALGLTNAESKDVGHKLVVTWRFDDTRLAAVVDWLTYRNNDSLIGAISEYKRNAYTVLIEQRFGAASFWVSFAKASDGACSRIGGAVCRANGVGAEYWTVGYIYRFSRRTELFAAYYRLSNRESGTYSPQPIVGASVAPGADTVGAGVGILHFF